MRHQTRPNPNDYLKPLVDIGFNHFNKGEFDQARICFEKALQKIQEIGHTSISHDRLKFDLYLQISQTYYKQLKYNDAIEFCQKAENMARTFKHRLHIAQALESRGKIKVKQQLFHAALDDYNEALQLKIAVHGSKHIDVADSYHAIAEIHVLQHQYNHALTLQENGLKIRLNKMGRDHFLVAQSYYSIGYTYYHLQQYDKALKNYKNCLNIRLKKSDNDYLGLAETYNGLGETYFKLHDDESAISMYQKSLNLKVSVFGDYQIENSNLYYRLSVVYLRQKQFEEAFFAIQKCLKIKLEYDGNNHIDVAKCYNTIACIYTGQGLYHDSAMMFRKSLQIKLNIAGYDQFDIADSYHNCGNAYLKIEEYQQALLMYQKSLFILLQIAKNDSHRKHIADLYRVIAKVYSYQCKDAEAIVMLEKYCNIILSQHGECQKVAAIYKEIASKYEKLHQQNEASRMHQEALRIIKNFSDENDSPKSIALAQHAIGDPNYYKAFMKVLKDEKCRSDCTPIVFVGPENSGKTSIMKLFSRQELIPNLMPTQIIDNPGIMIDLNSYKIFDSDTCDIGRILDRKVVAAIESTKWGMIYQEDMKDSNHSKSSIAKTADDSRLNNEKIQASLITPNQLHEESIGNLKPYGDHDYLSNAYTKPVNLKHYLDIFNNYYEHSLVIESDVKTHGYNCGKLWDFGGNPMHWIAHQPFMSGNSIYILTYNIAQDINQIVQTTDIDPNKMTYLQTIEECITNIVGRHSNQNRIEPCDDDNSDYDNDGISNEYSLPVIILVASHGDCVQNIEEQRRLFEGFEQALLASLPQYEKHICSSSIIFNCDPHDTSPATISQRKQSCHHLQQIIQRFYNSLPLLKNFIPIRWQIMSNLILKSSNRSYHQVNSILVDKINKIMFVNEIKQLSIDCGLYQGDQDLHDMLKSLHNLGDILYFQDNQGEGIIITQIEWLSDIFRRLFTMGKNARKVIGRRFLINYAARFKGKIPQSYLDNILKKISITDKHKQIIYHLMEKFDMIYPMEKDENDNSDDLYYFAPFTVEPRISLGHINLARYHVSDWLYIGYDQNELSFIPTSVFISLLVACFKQWKNSKVELYYNCVKYYVKANQYSYYLIVKKAKRHIGLRYYCEKESNATKDNITKVIDETRPQDFVYSQLIAILKEKLPTINCNNCQFSIQCHCNEMVTLNGLDQRDYEAIECHYCHQIVRTHYLKDWTIYTRNSEVPQCYFFKISKHIGIDWTKLAAKLDANIDVDTIKVENQTVFDRALKLLNEWFNRNCSSNATQNLITALRDIDRYDILLKLGISGNKLDM
ncbi:uncharacterized protein TRIADDRAFT_61019 [Trichoplax adhaerens]|uniref:Death domain-containing protein n=1 Tax=Trichoplax adhaerens TaxID=10228 RepID=B3S9T3_TRIAD|nr:hypothetical protein TRIADDRAFT_61019 [Trichoplax adhaerens]EDV20526.1 hypothetical protein TRIADDRAFT_61019 [Trichoplax adhaerens]|eukprot:XP_002116952.1 hypothetical protein TRIADDRAFT_61019 [Trichoplax adhaerens]